MDRIRDVAYGGDSQKVMDKWPMEVREIINTNLQALQNSKVSSFSDLPDWVNQGSASEKALKGHDLKGARQLTIKHRNSYRVAYIAEFEGVVVVLHCFKKQTEGRQSKDMKTVAARLSGAYAEFGYKT